MSSTGDSFALFDSDNGGATLLTGYRREIVCNGSFENRDRVESAFAEIEAASDKGEWVALAVEYGLGASFEEQSVVPGSGGKRLQGWVFGEGQRLDAQDLATFLQGRLASCPAELRVAGVASLRPSWSAADYVRKVGQIRHWIAEGDCYQINLTFPIDFLVYGHPLALYAALRERQPVRYGGFVSVPGATLLSFSPELFFERCGDRVVTRPMKGTAPRGCTPQEDAAFLAGLQASEKERAENVMIVDLLRNDLGRLALPGKVKVEALCAVEAYPTLWQSVSTVSAELPDVRLFDLFCALFPCGSITGAPKIRAMQRIAELENHSRELYTGSLGWVAPGRDCRFNVAIRTIELGDSGSGRMGVGSGIVIDADAQKEYAECLLKARFLTAYDPGFELIETMRLENGICPLRVLHIERLCSSARELGFVLDEKALAVTLDEYAAAHPEGIWRIRLSLAHNGRLQVNVAEFDQQACPCEVLLADETLPDNDYLRRHKTTARNLYDKVLVGLPAGKFDAIFFNSRGEVCEGARSNVFVERNGLLLTPPLSCGLLPGVMRRQLIESGRAVERVLCRDDLLGAETLYLANALRGLMRMTLSKPCLIASFEKK